VSRSGRWNSLRLRRDLPVAWVAALALLLLTGCKDDPQQAPASKPVVAAGQAKIEGAVRFDGTPPAPRPLGDQICGATKLPIMDESLVVGSEGGIGNVVVYLENGPNVERKTEPAVLDQKECRYVPHVLAVRTGQTVRVTSSDATLHNAHADKGKNPPFNLSFAAAGQAREVTFAQTEVAVRVRCDVHQWMSAYIAAFDHPFFAVTGEDGRFELTEVPPGSYTLTAWHERYGSRSQPVTVGDDGVVKAEFAFGK